MSTAAAPARTGSAPALPGGLYYGWVLVLALGVTETVSYGILAYAFPVFIAPMGAELGWSKTAVTGAFSLASLVAGAAAFPLVRGADRPGARGVMTAGSVLAALVLLGWSRVQTLPAFYLLSVGLGLAMAATLYEPAFAVVATWFARLRGRALTVLTFMGGFASVVFVPLATRLVAAHGWRAALAVLAALLAEMYGPAQYGSISGVLAGVLALARAAAPVGASLLYVAAGGYGAVLAALFASCALSSAAVLLAGRREAPALTLSAEAA